MCLSSALSRSEEKINQKRSPCREEEEEGEGDSPGMTPEDCDPVVREVVEDTRAAVEEMMKELNDMVNQSTQTSSS